MTVTTVEGPLATSADTMSRPGMSITTKRASPTASTSRLHTGFGFGSMSSDAWLVAGAARSSRAPTVHSFLIDCLPVGVTPWRKSPDSAVGFTLFIRAEHSVHHEHADARGEDHVADADDVRSTRQ